MNKIWKWIIRSIVTLIAAILEVALAQTPTLDVGSILIVMLLIAAITVWVWWLTRTKKLAIPAPATPGAPTPQKLSTK